MAFKALIKRILPERVKTSIGSLLIKRRERRLGRLAVSLAFDEVYKRRMWKQGASLSGVGSEGPLADQYVTLVREYAAANELRTVLDGGCGDFAVGSRLAAGFSRYTALDVSPHIIEINRRKYSGSAWGHVSFDVADLMSAALPEVDLILIRQVLQHLTNAQIELILKNLDRSNWRRVLITESVHDPRHNESPNLDLSSHTVRTRASIGSGVFVDRPPFSREATRLATLYCSADGAAQTGGLLVFELKRDR